MPDGVIKGVAEAEFVPEVARDLERLVPGVDGRRIASRVRQGPFPVSFDPEAVLDAPRAELVGLGHPLVRLAVAWITESSAQAFRRFAVRLTPSNEIPRGRYAFDVRRFEVSGIRERSEVVAFAYSFNSERLLPEDEARALLLAMIDDGQDLLQSITELRLPFAQASAALDRAIDAEHARIDREEKLLEEGRADQRRAIRQGQLESRLAAEKRRLSKMRYGSKSPRAIRSSEGRVAAAQDRLQSFLDEPPARGLAACQVGRIAEGIVIVD